MRISKIGSTWLQLGVLVLSPACGDDAGAAEGSAEDAGRDASVRSDAAQVDAAQVDAARPTDAGLRADGGVDAALGDGAVPRWQTAPLPDVSKIDLSLGDLNQDLVPSGDCLSKLDESILCMDLLGEYDGERFSACDNFSISAGSGLGSQNFGCDVTLTTGALLEISVNLSNTLIGTLPSTFSFSSPPDADEATSVSFYVTATGAAPFSSRVAEKDAKLSAETRIRGVAGLRPGALRTVEASQLEQGSLAFRATPTASCVAGVDACHTIRLRANFTARTGWSK